MKTDRRRAALATTFTIAFAFAAQAGCSSDDGPPLTPQYAASDAGSTLFTSDAAPPPPPVLPPLDPGPPPAPVDAGPEPFDGGPIPCDPGGELEVEPNEDTPNELNGIRCGVIHPGDPKDVLRTSRTSFNIEWTGAVDVKAVQPILGGPYNLEITALDPSTATYWVVRFTD